MILRIRRNNNTPRTIVTTAFVVIGLAFGVWSYLQLQRPVDAADLRNFDPGNIMSDAVMANKSSMTEAQIQAFLESKNPCNNTNISKASQYHKVKDGRFVCMYEDTFDGETAAHIIWQAAQDYSINPQVIIVLLQKEQGLITDTWPNSIQYNKATGYGCPDTAACDTQYYGLKNQIRQAANLFRNVLNGGWTNYPVGNNYVQYNPNTACGGTTINIKNRATSALYRYTPYQPNQSALNAGYGTGDGCGAYGNRNFWLYFTDWFGSTLHGPTPTSSIYLADGVYSLIGKDSNKALDVVGASINNGASVQIWEENGTTAQKWRISKDKDNYYTIINVNSGKLLGAQNSNANRGAKIQVWNNDDLCYQKWAVTSVGTGVSFLNKCSGLALDVSGASSQNGASVQLWDNNLTNAQVWTLKDLSLGEIKNGIYEISISGGLVLETVDHSVNNLTQARIGTKTNALVQKWHVSKQLNGYYTIRNVESNRLLSVSNGSKDNGANVQIANSTMSCSSYWIIHKLTSQSYTLQSACSDRVLDVRDGKISTPETLLQIWDGNETASQKWFFTPLPDSIPDGAYSIMTSTGMALDITGGNLSNGASSQIWPRNYSGAQNWTFERQGSGLYKITNSASGKALDISSAALRNGTRIQLWSNNGSCVQIWKMVPKPDNQYEILSTCSDKWSLDISGGKINTAGTPVQLWSRNYSEAQAWTLGNPRQ